MSGEKSGQPPYILGRISVSEFTSSVVLSYAVAVLLVVWVVTSVGGWEILATTRFLDFLVAAGIVQYHDLLEPALFELPNVGLWFDTQMAIDWRLVAAAIVAFMVFSLIKAYQFSEIARVLGVEGTLGQHIRAYLYGDGIDRFLPFYIGSIGTASALANQGARFNRALSATGVIHFFMIFEVTVFSVILLAFLGWSDWIAYLVWPLAMLGMVLLLIRPEPRTSDSSVDGGGDIASLGRFTLVAGAQFFRVMARDNPAMLLKLCAVSIVAFWVLDVAVYFVVEAWNDLERSYSEPFPVLLMAVVGGYLARFIPITPGGIGQWEFGFGATFAIYGSDAYGIDLNFNLILAAVLVGVLRSLTGFLIMGAVLIFYGMPANLKSVVRIFRGVEQPSEAP